MKSPNHPIPEGHETLPSPAQNDRLSPLALTGFAFGFTVYWLGGFGSCAGLPLAVTQVVFPIVVTIGLGLQLLGIVLLIRRAMTVTERKTWWLIAILIVFLLAGVLWALISVPFVAGGMKIGGPP